MNENSTISNQSKLKKGILGRLTTPKILFTLMMCAITSTVVIYLFSMGIFAASTPADFTIVTIPDTQYYSSQSRGGDISTFAGQVNWICNQPNLNIKLATHLGDIVDKGVDTNALNRAKSAMAPLKTSEIAYDILPGNHEGYNNFYLYNVKNLVNYNNYFPLSDFSNKSWFGGSYPSGTMNNSYVVFTSNGMNFINISLGYKPDEGTKNWANSVLDSHPNHRAIISTHDYMSTSGRSTIGQGIWDSIIKNHANVFMVLCGHNTREKLITSTNTAGKPVYQLMSDYQSDSKGGNGWLRYYKFVPSQNKIEAYTYSSLLNTYETDADSRFDLTYNME